MSTDKENLQMYDGNKTLCPHPWIHSYIGSFYERQLCCVAAKVDEYQKVPSEDFWNSKYMKDVRLKMLNGQKVKECSACYELESKGVRSLRQMSTDANRFKDANELFKTNPDGSVDRPPSYFDYRTIYCNLQCVSCGWVFSSRHINLHNKRWNSRPEDDQLLINRDVAFEKVMMNEIITSLQRKDCETIYWAGGEPMISNIHWGVVNEMKRLREDPEYRDYIDQLNIHYNTNMTQLMHKHQSIPELLEFNQPSIQASIDGTHETFEYTRDGAKWDKVSKNWDAYYAKLNKNRQMGIASVLHLPVLLDIDRWFDFFEQYDVIVYNHNFFTFVERPSSFLDVRLLPQHIFDRVIGHAIERFEKTALRSAEHSINVIKSYIRGREELKEQYFDNKDYLIECKAVTMDRDKYMVNGRSFEELLKILDTETYEWYKSIPVYDNE